MATVVGLDIGHYSVKAIRLQSTYRGFVTLGFDEEVLETVLVLADPSSGGAAAAIDDWVSANTASLRALYSPTLQKLKVLVTARDVPISEMQAARDAIERQVLGPDRPLTTISYLFTEEDRARANIEELREYGLECWAVIDGIEVRLDTIDDEDSFSDEQLEDAIHSAEDEALHSALSKLAERGAFDGENLAVAMPPDLVMSTRLALPLSDNEQIRAVAAAEFADLAPLPVSQLLQDHHVIGASAAAPGANDIMVSAVKRDDLEVFLEIWQAGGVDPHAVLMADASMLHLSKHLLAGVPEVHAIIDIGHRFTRVAIVEPPPPGDSGPPRLGYCRTIQFGGHDITMALQSLLGTTYRQAEAYKHAEGFVATDTITMGLEGVKVSDTIKRTVARLIRELRGTFHAHLHERRDPVQRMFLCGGTSRLPGLARYLADELMLDASDLPFDSEALADLDVPVGSRPASAAAPLALALREVFPNDERVRVNFRRGEFAHKASKGFFRERLFGLVALGVGLLIVLCAFLVSEYLQASWQLEATDEALNTATERLFGEATTNPETIKTKLGGSSDPGLIPEHTAYDFYYEVAEKMQAANVELYVLDVDTFRQLIKVEGRTDSAAAVDNIVDSLEQFDCFKGQVQKGDVKTVGEQVQFSLNIAPECGGDKEQGKE